MDTSFIALVKADDIQKELNTSNSESDRPLPREKIKKVIGLIKYELGKDIKKEFVELRAKTYSYIKRKNDKHKKAKETKNVS